MSLFVEHDVYRVGEATVAGDRFAFEYDPGWQALHFAFPLSVTLPLRRRAWPPSDAHPFFANLLPEGLARQALCDRLGLSFDNDVALLTALGGDTAGAFRFDAADRERRKRARLPLSTDELASWARGAPALPPLDESVRLSLAGAQHKTSAVRTASGWALPASGEASTHILKFDSERFPHLSVNEFCTTRFAHHLGLDVAEVSLDTEVTPPFLVVTRYDRTVSGDEVERVHQEDFCQLFGLMPFRKYEADGGPTLRMVAEKIREVSQRPAADLQMLVRWVVFCALAGNADGHAKNLSVVYRGRQLELAPLYDLVCTRAFPRVDTRLAFSVGGERDADSLRRRHWEALAADLGVRPRAVVAEVERQLEGAGEAFDKATEDATAALGSAPPIIVTLRQSLEKRRRALRAERR